MVGGKSVISRNKKMIDSRTLAKLKGVKEEGGSLTRALESVEKEHEFREEKIIETYLTSQAIPMKPDNNVM